MSTESVTAQGIGASLSNAVAGLIVVNAGYSATFLTLAAVVLTAFVVFLVAMPETGKPKREERDAEAASRPPKVQSASAATAAD